MTVLPGERWDYAAAPGAVHGKFVPGLPWDSLPKPRWIDDSPVPELVEQFEALQSEADEADGRADELEDEAHEARNQADKFRAVASGLLARIEAADGAKAAELRETHGL